MVFVPEALYPRIEQSALVLGGAREPALARAFLAHLTGPKGQQSWRARIRPALSPSKGLPQHPAAGAVAGAPLRPSRLDRLDQGLEAADAGPVLVVRLHDGQGQVVEVWVIMSSPDGGPDARFFRLRQSSGVILYRLVGSFSRSRKQLRPGRDVEPVLGHHRPGVDQRPLELALIS